MSFADRVAAASAAWVYLPDDAQRVVTDEFAVIGYPLMWTQPTQVQSVASDRDPGQLIAEVGGIVRGWGRDDAAWWMTAHTRPAGLEAALGRVGELVETVTVLAFDLTGGWPDVGQTVGASAQAVTTPARAWRFAAVNCAAWDAPMPDDERIAQWLREYEDGQSVRVVVSVDGEPASCGGVNVVDGVARLWGGATVPGLRGRGAYRAGLRERLRIARDNGATMALVKGRVDTSGPVLGRAGFAAFGEERAYLVAV